jgi:antitoxin component YwqK of YwqJK toxin-antitoxin module
VNRLAATLLLAAVPACKPDRLPLEIDYPDGTPHFRAGTVDGRFDGPYRRWWPDGRLAFEGSYREGKLEGPWKEWHENGAPAREASSRAGHLEGRWVAFDEQGRMIEECDYKRGARHGLRIVHNEDGSRVESEWTNGERVGRERGFDTQGRAAELGVLARRPADHEATWHANGRLATRVPLVDGRRDGECRTWFPTGEARSLMTYTKGRLQGRFVRWHPNGQVALEGLMEDGQRSGVWRAWTQEGELEPEQSGLYVDGERTRGLASTDE